MASPPRIAVLTGATGGIGRWIALGLARADYHLVVICRDRSRGEALTQWLVQQTSSPVTLDIRLADLSSLAETRQVGERIARDYPSITLLINNAGIFRADWRTTSEGREDVLAVNHLSPYLLSDVLEDALRAGAPSRIVNVGSSTSDSGRLDPHRLERGKSARFAIWDRVRAYRESKLAMMLATFTRAERLQGSGVTANVVHPGMVATGLIRERGAIGLAWKIMAPFCLSEEQGARTPVFAALDPSWAALTGKYLKKCAVARPNPCSADAPLRDAVEVATRGLIAETVGAQAR
ncbi:SDR family NAD(P)-dependent oxidoreductase [Robbsia sp. KACC 23696]|uniref:SDR family NAD(P)-dependent oxidoreductase n=1 Tax=Robbsia sp. KACC 23696 TaxID=3149231 RepID=UPI00325C227D